MPPKKAPANPWVYADKRQESFEKPARKAAAWPFTNAAHRKLLLTGEFLSRFGFYYDPKTCEGHQVICSYCSTTCDWNPGLEKSPKGMHPLAWHHDHSPCWGAKLWAFALSFDEEKKFVVDSLNADFASVSDDDVQAWLLASMSQSGLAWPFHAKAKQTKPTAADMASAGFLHQPLSGSDDHAMCPFCSVSLDGWEKDDNVRHEHSKRSSHCSFLHAGFAKTSPEKPKAATAAKPARKKGKPGLDEPAIDPERTLEPVADKKTRAGARKGKSVPATPAQQPKPPVPEKTEPATPDLPDVPAEEETKDTAPSKKRARRKMAATDPVQDEPELLPEPAIAKPAETSTAADEPDPVQKAPATARKGRGRKKGAEVASAEPSPAATPAVEEPARRTRKGKTVKKDAEEPSVQPGPDKSQSETVQEPEKSTKKISAAKKRGRNADVAEEPVEANESMAVDETIDSIAPVDDAVVRSPDQPSASKKRTRRNADPAPVSAKDPVPEAEPEALPKKRSRKAAQVGEKESTSKDEPVASARKARGRKLKPQAAAKESVQVAAKESVQVAAKESVQVAAKELVQVAVKEESSFQASGDDVENIPPANENILASPAAKPIARSIPPELLTSIQPMLDSCQVTSKQVEELYQLSATPDMTVQQFMVKLGDLASDRLDHTLQDAIDGKFSL
ncbi:hypothetical protein HDV03_003685 [Kappamyces sp. JEL0829]|nr:hypothetical protein HDV03_003685 [Kappamyces sp. JEL0829]